MSGHDDKSQQLDEVASTKSDAAAGTARQAPNATACSSILSKLRVAVLAVLLIVVQTLQVVSFKKAGYSYRPYPYMILIIVAAAFVPLFAIAAGIISCRTGGFLPEITSCKFKMHYSIVGLFNALNGILIIFSNPHVTGVLQSILAQAVIPFTLLLSIIWLRTRFKAYQYVGAFIVICGVGVSLIPTFEPTPNTTLSDSGSSGQSTTALVFTDDSDDTDSTSSLIIWAIIFTMGQLPQALCSIYQEKVFVGTSAKVSVVYMLVWASLSQIVVLVLAFPINLIPWFGAMTIEEAGAYLKNASDCLVAAEGTPAVCSQAALDLSFCILTMLLTNLVQAYLVKYSSAVLSVFVITLVTPVSAFAFTFQFLMGDDVESVNMLELVALAVLMVGILIYRGEAIIEALRKRLAQGKTSALNEELISDGELTDVVSTDGLDNDGALSGAEPVHEHAQGYGGAHGRSKSRDAIPAPTLLNSRAGIINFEHAPGETSSIWLAGTLADRTAVGRARANSAPTQGSPLISDSGRGYGSTHSRPVAVTEGVTTQGV